MDTVNQSYGAILIRRWEDWGSRGHFSGTKIRVLFIIITVKTFNSINSKPNNLFFFFVLPFIFFPFVIAYFKRFERHRNVSWRAWGKHICIHSSLQGASMRNRPSGFIFFCIYIYIYQLYGEKQKEEEKYKQGKNKEMVV